MEKEDNTTSTIVVSSKRLRNCDKVVDFIKSLKVSANIKDNRSVICNSYDCWLEYGCDITLTGLKSEFIKNDVWMPLSKHFGFDCAYLKVNGKYKGCVHDFENRSYHE